MRNVQLSHHEKKKLQYLCLAEIAFAPPCTFLWNTNTRNFFCVSENSQKCHWKRKSALYLAQEVLALTQKWQVVLESKILSNPLLTQLQHHPSQSLALQLAQTHVVSNSVARLRWKRESFRELDSEKEIATYDHLMSFLFFKLPMLLSSTPSFVASSHIYSTRRRLLYRYLYKIMFKRNPMQTMHILAVISCQSSALTKRLMLELQ